MNYGIWPSFNLYTVIGHRTFAMPSDAGRILDYVNLSPVFGSTCVCIIKEVMAFAITCSSMADYLIKDVFDISKCIIHVYSTPERSIFFSNGRHIIHIIAHKLHLVNRPKLFHLLLLTCNIKKINVFIFPINMCHKQIYLFMKSRLKVVKKTETLTLGFLILDRLRTCMHDRVNTWGCSLAEWCWEIDFHLHH